MNDEPIPGAEAAARVLALMVAANGRIDERELRALEELDAFNRIGIARPQFIALAEECLREVGGNLCERSWLSVADRLYVERLLQGVAQPAQRLLVCRFAAAIITADGRVTQDERLVYEHALATWRISHCAVSKAILGDPVH